MILYASLEDAKRELDTLRATTVSLSVDDQKMIGKLQTVSRRVDNLFPQTPRWPVFAPWIGTRLIPVTGFNTNSWQNTLSFQGFLLALTSTSVNGTDITDAAAYPDPNSAPFNMLRRSDGCLDWYSTCQSLCDNAPLQASLTGVWGFNSDYANAWMSVDVLVTPFITTTSQTTFKVVDVDGGDLYNVTPRISIGNLLKIEDEFVEVTLTDSATNTVTVKRGVNGSTAAIHGSGLPVYRWEVEAPVRNAVARQAAMQYERIGAFTTVEVQGMSEVRYPSDWLNEVYAALQGYA